jgi:hypothetical protein
MVWASISLAIGERVHPPTLGLTAAANKSPKMPIGAADEVMNPKKRECPLNKE